MNVDHVKMYSGIGARRAWNNWPEYASRCPHSDGGEAVGKQTASTSSYCISSHIISVRFKRVREGRRESCSGFREEMCTPIKISFEWLKVSKACCMQYRRYLYLMSSYSPLSWEPSWIILTICLLGSSGQVWASASAAFFTRICERKRVASWILMHRWRTCRVCQGRDIK